MMTLQTISTTELINELNKRENVFVADVRPDGIQCVMIDTLKTEKLIDMLTSRQVS